MNRQEASHTATEVVSGALTIFHAQEIRTRFLALADQNTHVTLDARDVTEVDLTFIQLVIALNKTQSEKGGSVSLTPACRALLDPHLLRAGLAYRDDDGGVRAWAPPWNTLDATSSGNATSSWDAGDAGETGGAP